MNYKSFCVAGILSFMTCSLWAGNFITRTGSHFVREGKPYYFIGANFWYGSILGSEGQGGNKERLVRELDSLKAIGIDNLRLLVGPDAGSCHANSVRPVLQERPGVLNDSILKGLDFLLFEMGKRDMTGVIYLNNAWDWSGGYGFYLKNTGDEDSPNAAEGGYQDYVNYASRFSSNKAAISMFQDYVRSIVSRKNTFSNTLYKDDPAIMSWQICNEPRPFSKEVKSEFYDWVSSTAQLIKELDPNHLVSTGSEGLYGCESDESLCTKLHNCVWIDYLTVHIWPQNWRWTSRDRLYEALPNVYLRSNEYLDVHRRISKRINKPLVIEEFGYARDRNMYEAGSSTMARDAFYNYVFSQVVDSKVNGGCVAGCNFWGWAGEGRPVSSSWNWGDDYIADPPHEPQGWYSVYNSDSTTIAVIKKAIGKLTK